MPDMRKTPKNDGNPRNHLDGRMPERPAPAESDELAITMDLPKVPRRGVIAIVIVLILLAAGLFFLGWIPHARRLSLAAKEAAETAQSKPVVEVVAPRILGQDNPLTLPGDVRANQSTAIFARASGYLKPLPAGIDIGAKVQEGQLIAEIAAPDLDAQLEQAKATLVQTRAAAARLEQQYALDTSTLSRYEAAGSLNAVSQQDLDERRSQQSVGAAALAEAKANVVAAEATAQRLTDLQKFERIVAPFSGIITARGYDAGALISAADTAAGKELFRIEQVDVLRVQVNVPQSYATGVQVGQTAQLTVKNFPGKSFAGTVARSAGAIDPSTRTLRVEVDVPNKDGQLLPGMFGQVAFQGRRDQASVVVPSSSLVVDARGVRVAAVEGSHVRYHAVELGRDYGSETEVVNGLAADQQVVKNPGTLVDGTEVSIVRTPAP